MRTHGHYMHWRALTLCLLATFEVGIKKPCVTCVRDAGLPQHGGRWGCPGSVAIWPPEVKGMNALECRVSTAANGRQSHQQSDKFGLSDLAAALSWSLSCLDQQVLRVLADSHLAVDELTITFKFPSLVPRGRLAHLWIDAVHRLSEVVSVLPETADALPSK